jgi:hypothetical protein
MVAIAAEWFGLDGLPVLLFAPDRVGWAMGGWTNTKSN